MKGGGSLCQKKSTRPNSAFLEMNCPVRQERGMEGGSALEDLFFLGGRGLFDLLGIIVDDFLEQLQAVELVVLGDLLVILELLDLVLALAAHVPEGRLLVVEHLFDLLGRLPAPR